MIGPGKYGELAEDCLIKCGASAVVLIVFGGNKGSGMSQSIKIDYEVAGVLTELKKLPDALRDIAKAIEDGTLR